MNIQRYLRLTHNPDTDKVRIRIRRRTTSNGERGYTITTLDTIDRADLRKLCDAIHDYADALDQKDNA